MCCSAWVQQVRVLVRGAQILRGFDADVVTHLTTELAHSGLQFHFGHNITAIHRTT